MPGPTRTPATKRKATPKKTAQPTPSPTVFITVERMALVPSRDGDARSKLASEFRERRLKLTRSGDEGVVRCQPQYKATYSRDWRDCDDVEEFRLEDLKVALEALEREE